MYINTETLDYPLTLRQVRQANPNVSLPKKPSTATLSALGYAEVQPTERPVGDVVTEGQPEPQPDGSWQQTWEARSYTAEEAEARFKATVPSYISPRQARLALLQEGMLSQVETSLDALQSPEREAAKVEWEYATSIERSSLLVEQLGQSLGLTEKQVDELFILGESL